MCPGAESHARALTMRPKRVVKKETESATEANNSTSEDSMAQESETGEQPIDTTRPRSALIPLPAD